MTPANASVASVCGFTVTALTMEPLSTMLRCASTVNDDLFVSGPPALPSNSFSRKGALVGEYGLRVFQKSSAKFHCAVPRYLSEPGLVKISILPRSEEHTSELQATCSDLEGSLGGRVWIARVPKVVGEIPLRRSAILVGARLGEDFDLAVAQLVILRRERVLVDANLADGFLRRELAAAEAIHEDGSAVGAGRGSRQGREVGSQIVRIVGKRFEVGAAQHHGAGAARGIGGQRLPGRVLHRQTLGKTPSPERQVQGLRTGEQRHPGRLGQG